MGKSDAELIHQNFVAGWVTFSIGACSLFASLLILHIIFRFKRWNGYMMLISSLVSVQFLFDISHMLYISPTSSNCKAIRFMTVVSGLSLTLWTNIITFVAFYIVYYGRLVDIFGNYKYFLMIALGIPIIFAICLLAENDFIETSDGGCYFAPNVVGNDFFDVYYYGRLILIGSNSCVVLFITHLTKLKVNKEKDQQQQQQLQQFATSNSEEGKAVISSAAVADESTVSHSININNNSHYNTVQQQLQPSEKTQAMIALIRRLKFYPLVQLICRSLSIWNEFDRGKFGGYPSEILSAIFSPAFGTGYLIVFLVVMPRAYQMLRDSLSCQCSKQQSRPHDNSIIANMTENELETLIHEEDAKKYSNSDHRFICCKSFDFGCVYHSHSDNEDSVVDTESSFPPAAAVSTTAGAAGADSNSRGSCSVSGNQLGGTVATTEEGTMNPVFGNSKAKKMGIGKDSNSSSSSPKSSNGSRSKLAADAAPLAAHIEMRDSSTMH